MTSTVVRFAAAMGYEGYPQLRERLRGLVSQRLTSEQRFAIASGIEQGDVLATVLKNDAHNIRKTVEALSQKDFDDVARRLLDARRIYVMGLVRGAAGAVHVPLSSSDLRWGGAGEQHRRRL